jgi:hypothetical protein
MGAEMILLASPNIDVVLGADTVVLGALGYTSRGRQGPGPAIPRRHRRRARGRRQD